MQRWSFNLQVYYLTSRISKIQEINKSGKATIQDRTLYEDAYIFAPNLHSMGLMTTRDFETYFSLFKLQESFINPPDLLIYLRASVSTLVNQIQKRGRDYEESIRLDYLKRLNERYEAWISTYDQGKILIIDVDTNNFSEKAEDLGIIINNIDAELHGLFKTK
jgi:deoxyadenosine/deoxycytidine kinase